MIASDGSMIELHQMYHNKMPKAPTSYQMILASTRMTPRPIMLGARAAARCTQTSRARQTVRSTAETAATIISRVARQWRGAGPRRGAALAGDGGFGILRRPPFAIAARSTVCGVNEACLLSRRFGSFAAQSLPNSFRSSTFARSRVLRRAAGRFLPARLM